MPAVKIDSLNQKISTILETLSHWSGEDVKGVAHLETPTMVVSLEERNKGYTSAGAFEGYKRWVEAYRILATDLNSEERTRLSKFQAAIEEMQKETEELIGKSISYVHDVFALHKAQKLQQGEEVFIASGFLRDDGGHASITRITREVSGRFAYSQYDAGGDKKNTGLEIIGRDEVGKWRFFRKYIDGIEKYILRPNADLQAVINAAVRSRHVDYKSREYKEYQETIKEAQEERIYAEDMPRQGRGNCTTRCQRILGKDILGEKLEAKLLAFMRSSTPDVVSKQVRDAMLARLLHLQEVLDTSADVHPQQQMNNQTFAKISDTGNYQVAGTTGEGELYRTVPGIFCMQELEEFQGLLQRGGIQATLYEHESEGFYLGVPLHMPFQAPSHSNALSADGAVSRAILLEQTKREDAGRYVGALYVGYQMPKPSPPPPLHAPKWSRKLQLRLAQNAVPAGRIGLVVLALAGSIAAGLGLGSLLFRISSSSSTPETPTNITTPTTGGNTPTPTPTAKKPPVCYSLVPPSYENIGSDDDIVEQQQAADRWANSTCKGHVTPCTLNQRPGDSSNNGLPDDAAYRAATISAIQSILDNNTGKDVRIFVATDTNGNILPEQVNGYPVETNGSQSLPDLLKQLDFSQFSGSLSFVSYNDALLNAARSNQNAIQNTVSGDHIELHVQSLSSNTEANFPSNGQSPTEGTIPLVSPDSAFALPGTNMFSALADQYNQSMGGATIRSENGVIMITPSSSSSSPAAENEAPATANIVYAGEAAGHTAPQNTLNRLQRRLAEQGKQALHAPGVPLAPSGRIERPR